MNRQTFIRAILLSVSTTIAVGVLAQTSAAVRAKVIFQVSDGDAGKWNLTLNNARNVQHELGTDKVSVEMVAFGPGIGMLKADAVISNRVIEAIQSGVQIVACENTMKSLKLTKADMNPVISYVPAGVVEIMKRQGEGWAYIKP